MTDGTPAPARPRSRVAAAPDFAAVRLLLRHSALGREVRRFALRMEERVLPVVRGAGAYDGEIAVRSGDQGRTANIQALQEPGSLGPFERLARFLTGVGVRCLALDSDLESDQIQDVLETLWAMRGHLRRGGPNWVDYSLGRHLVCDALTSDSGMHLACANVRLDQPSGRLCVRNSYCQLTFSRAVTAYKQRGSRFRDHRAFFHAAPKLGLMAACLTFVPPAAVFLFGCNVSIVIGAGLVVAALVGFGSVVVFEAIGAVEYDKEHQARQLEQRHRALVRAHEDIQADLQRAKRIQSMLIPEQDLQPFPDHVRLAHSLVPEMAVSGDYYDFQRAGDDRLAILFADVSGHGMAGAFVTGIIKTTFESRDRTALQPHQFVSDVNDVLDSITPPDSFATVVYALYDVARRVLVYTNAGHSPLPMVVRREERTVQALDGATGLVAGINPGGAYEQGEVQLAPGDKFVLCTDGIIECQNEDGEQFGLDRLHALLCESADQAAAGVRDRIVRAVADYSGTTSQADDQTVLVMEVLR